MASSEAARSSGRAVSALKETWKVMRVDFVRYDRAASVARDTGR